VKGGPINAYFDSLDVGLRRRSRRDARSLSNGAEAHLREADDNGVWARLSPEEADAGTDRRFGERGFGRPRPPRGRLSLARGMFMSAGQWGPWGAVAVGVSGLAAGATCGLTETQRPYFRS
jgi:hypothetical protein